MKRKTKIALGSIIGLSAIMLLSSCTKSFCNNTDTARALYAYDPGITRYDVGEESISVTSGGYTYTVDNISLIASSIMSKKLAAGSDAIVLDVKTGSGAFMKNFEDSKALAEEMVRIGNNAGRKTIAVISDMDQPLGFAVGNALEVKEAIDTLNGHGPEDFTKLVMTMGTQMLLAGNAASTEQEALVMLEDAISSGKALNKLAEFVSSQGGDPSYVFNPCKLCKAEQVVNVFSEKEGYISGIVCDEVGICSMILGGGRETKESEIDLSVGIVLKKKVGDYVKKGDILAEIHSNNAEKTKEAMSRLLKTYSFTEAPVEKTDIIKMII